VLAVCRRITGHAHDAEDVFQAVFLVLARRAGSMTAPEAVGNWLYGVAVRIARQARAMAVKRRARERLTDPLPERGCTDAEPLAESDRAILDEELAQLPDRYRELVVLCDLEGEPQVELARRFGLPVGTVYSRLATARARLAGRLRKRGLAPAVAAAIKVCEVPRSLAATVARMGSDVAGTVPAHVASLADGAIRAMTFFQYKIAVTVVVLALFGAGAAYAAGLFDPRPADQPPPKKNEVADQPARKAKLTPEELKERDLKLLQGKWVVIHEVYVNTTQKGDRGTWVFKGDKIITNDKTEGTFTIDTTTRPRQLIRKFTDDENRKRTFAYIYTFDEDHLLLSGRVAFFDEDHPPRDFSSDLHFLRLERRDD
jgi:RNA polymerase sigma factor (sigma-70 family)